MFTLNSGFLSIMNYCTILITLIRSNFPKIIPFDKILVDEFFGGKLTRVMKAMERVISYAVENAMLCKCYESRLILSIRVSVIVLEGLLLIIRRRKSR